MPECHWGPCPNAFLGPWETRYPLGFPVTTSHPCTRFSELFIHHLPRLFGVPTSPAVDRCFLHAARMCLHHLPGPGQSVKSCVPGRCPQTSKPSLIQPALLAPFIRHPQRHVCPLSSWQYVKARGCSAAHQSVLRRTSTARWAHLTLGIGQGAGREGQVLSGEREVC